MRKLNKAAILFSVVLMFSGEVMAHPVECAAIYDLKISELHPRIYFTDDVEKKSTVRISLPVSCKAGIPIVPESVEESVWLLDKALPLDLKSAILQGPYINPYIQGNYGSSADIDLSEFFFEKWNLSENNSICTQVNSLSEDEGDCFLGILELLRTYYIKGPIQFEEALKKISEEKNGGGKQGHP